MNMQVLAKGKALIFIFLTVLLVLTACGSGEHEFESTTDPDAESGGSEQDIEDGSQSDSGLQTRPGEGSILPEGSGSGAAEEATAAHPLTAVSPVRRGRMRSMINPLFCQIPKPASILTVLKSRFSPMPQIV